MRASRTPARLLLGAVGLVVLAGCSGGGTSATEFPDLTAGQRVYDDTGSSLTDAEVAGLQQQLDTLQTEEGADVIVYVRELDADSDDTFDQVEALQQAWVAEAGVDQDTAGAILINREPGADDEARAGVFVGATYNDGNVPGSEQEAIVEDALIPPLRDGDVAGSLSAGVERLGSSIRDGAPVTALNEFADGPGSTWLPGAGFALVAIGFALTLGLYSQRARAGVAELRPTTTRPDGSTSSAMAGALVAGGPQPSAVPATILDLATRDAVVIEQEREPGRLSQGSAQIRLHDQTQVRGDVERAVWDALQAKAEDGVVSSSKLTAVAHDAAPVRTVLQAELRHRGWWNERAGRNRALLVTLALLAVLPMVGGIVVTAAGSLLMLVVAIPAGVLVLTALVLATAFPHLSTAGQNAARPWEAYRDGLKAAGKDDGVAVDLDAVLPDVIALGLGDAFTKRLEAATDADDAGARGLRALSPPAGATYVANQAILPWSTFSVVFVSSGSGATASAGAGGGGGASGST